MDLGKLRVRVEAVLADLPPIFTVRDVCMRLGISERPANRVGVHAVLDRLVEEGRLFHSLALGGRLGRRPSAWSKLQDGQPDGVLEQAIRGVLCRMPRHFTLDELLSALGFSRRLAGHVYAVLERLESAWVVVRVTERPLKQRAGRHPKFWSADRAVVVSEMAFRDLIRRTGEGDPTVRMQALLDSFDPSDSSGK
jgi:hypothetical protein